MNASPRLTLLALAGVFLAPLLLAWTLYHQPAWHPAAALQHGELVSHGDAIGSGGADESALLHGRWTLLYHATGPCDRACRGLLDTLLRVRLAQGKGLGRIQRVLLTGDPTAANRALARGASDLRVVADAGWTLPADSVYLLDPHGRPVLRYRPGFAPMDLVADLRHLLRVAGEV